MTKIVCVGAETPSGCMVVADTLAVCIRVAEMLNDHTRRRHPQVR